ncbi:hypothetical protein [Rhodococcus kronopolitis]|uniref:Uncharacterized protein n=1 Tax=Rhodococcus kronopolitis TaxID=1460226 RepID=A0ABV9FV27_9NOCA
MKMLMTASAVSVLCFVSVWLYVMPQLASSGVIEPGPFFELMVVFPTLIGLMAAAVGAVAGVVVLLRGTARVWVPPLLMGLGQLTTLVLAVAIVVWALQFGSTGWELIALPASLMLGQVLVAVGLVTDVVRRRRGVRAQGALGG